MPAECLSLIFVDFSYSVLFSAHSHCETSSYSEPLLFGEGRVGDHSYLEASLM